MNLSRPVSHSSILIQFPTLQPQSIQHIVIPNRNDACAMCSSPCYCSWFGHWCKVWVRFRLGIAISTTRHRLRACKPLAPCRSPRARAFHLHLACTLSSSALRIRRLPPQIPLDRRLPPRSQVDLAVAPQNHRPRLKHRPRRISQHQKRKTPLVYVARIAHRPCLQLQSAEQPQSAPLAQRAAAIINGETTLSLLPASMYTGNW